MITVRPAQRGPKAAQQLLLGRGIERAGRLVEDQDSRIADQRAGDAEQLALAHRQSLARARPARCCSLRQALDEIVRADEAGGSDDARRILVGDAHRDVVQHRSAKSCTSCGTAPIWARSCAVTRCPTSVPSTSTRRRSGDEAAAPGWRCSSCPSPKGR
jgi:hypothetical protein